MLSDCVCIVDGYTTGYATARTYVGLKQAPSCRVVVDYCPVLLERR